ncbi:MAG: heme-binding domain-containing protein [bacterium]|nr:heme-binding domain-containing protein [bacterium]
MSRSSLARKWAKRIAVGAFVLLLAMQVVPYGRDHANPPVTGEPTWNSPRTRELFKQACGDCHSHETEWPWYSHIAPVSWLVQRDVEEGREHFNVSTWNRGPGDADEAAEEYEEGDMPLWFYTPLHPHAKHTPEDRVALLAGLRATFGDGEDD